MHVYTAYCGIRDRDVCVTMNEELSEEQQANLAIMCTKYSWAPICTGDFCPNFGSGLVAMGIRPEQVCAIT